MHLKKILILAALCLCLTGCSDFLERSYRVVEPYTDRYFASGKEDTLRAESYQDLVNSLLMLVEQETEVGVIEYYQPSMSQFHSQLACREVLEETALGSYLLSDITAELLYGEQFATLTFHMQYRQGVEPTGIPLTDTQSLQDLLRVYVREGHSSLTASFSVELSQTEVAAAVDALWQELAAEGTLDNNAQCPWSILYYPQNGSVGIVRILFVKARDSGLPQ